MTRLTLDTAADVEAHFLGRCNPGVSVFATGWAGPEPGERHGRHLVFWWDGHRAHYLRTRNPIKAWWTARTWCRGHNALRGGCRR